jgi:hypothetical protein
MLNKGSEFNCSNGDLNCLCPQQNFGYGIRDCADQACSSASDATTVKNFGNTLCAGSSHAGRLQMREVSY